MDTNLTAAVLCAVQDALRITQEALRASQDDLLDAEKGSIAMGQEEPEYALEGRARQAEQQLETKDRQLMEARSELEKVRLGLTSLSADT